MPSYIHRLVFVLMAACAYAVFIFLPTNVFVQFSNRFFNDESLTKAHVDHSNALDVINAIANTSSDYISLPRVEDDFFTSSIKVDNQLKGILVNLEAFTKDIETAGERLRQASAADIVRPSEKVNVSEKGFFDQVKRFPSVSTVLFQKDFEEMKKYLIHEYYHYTSNDCHLVEDTSVYGQGLGKEIFNAACHKDLNVHLRGHPLQSNHLSLGLPVNFTHVRGHETWTHLTVAQNAVVTDNGDILTRNLTLIPHRCKDKEQGNLPAQPNALQEYDAVFSAHQYWSEGFFHSSLEGIPRLASYVQFLNDNPRVRIHFQSNNPLQNVLGIRDLEKRRLSTPKFRAKVLYSPAGGPCGRPPLFSTQLLSLYARRHLPNSHRNKVILIKRSQKRFFNHHVPIEAMLKAEASSRGLELFVFRDDPVPSLDLIREMFNAAILIVAPHGAGESNILYSQPGTALVEGLCWDVLKRGNLCYRNAAQVLGMRYHAVFYQLGCGVVTADQLKEPVLFFLDHLDVIST